MAHYQAIFHGVTVMPEGLNPNFLYQHNLDLKLENRVDIEIKDGNLLVAVYEGPNLRAVKLHQGVHPSQITDFIPNLSTVKDSSARYSHQETTYSNQDPNNSTSSQASITNYFFESDTTTITRVSTRDSNGTISDIANVIIEKPQRKSTKVPHLDLLANS